MKIKKTGKMQSAAPTAQAVPMSVELTDIQAADWNVHGDPKGDGALDGLVASMRANGLIQRVTVREVIGAEVGEPSFEVIDGHRRVAAARALGWKEIPCDVVYATDEEAQLMTATANVQRLANDPQLEADLIGRLRDAGKTYAQIAAAMGKDERYVARRSRLASLTEKWRDFFRKAGAGADEADIMETVARHEPQTQDTVFDNCVEEDDAENGLPFDADDVESWFEDEMRKLDPDDVPFDVAGCAACAYNTATHGCLFPEYEDVCGRCQNAECFAARWNCAVDAAIEDLRKRGVEVKAAKDRWHVPNYWDTTPHKERKNVVPYVYDQNGLKRLVWARPNETNEDAPAQTEEEKAEARRVKSAHNAWAKNRRNAFEKIRKVAGSGDHAAFARSLVRADGFIEAMEERYARLLDNWLPDGEALTILKIVGAQDLGLTDEEAEAMESEDPAVSAARGQA